MIKPDTAMVLAAGLGTRMRPLTNDKPKPLIEVNGKPLIDYTLDRFAKAGLRSAVVNVHYLADKVEAHLKERRTPIITVSDERDELLETGGGVKKALGQFSSDAIFCTNTDAILTDRDGEEPCERLAGAWDPERMDALLLLSPMEETTGYDGAGDFDLFNDGQIQLRASDSAPYVFTGLQILSLDFFKSAPDGPFSTKLLWDDARQKGRLFGLVHSGFWMHVGDPDGLKQAEQKLRDMAGEQ